MKIYPKNGQRLILDLEMKTRNYESEEPIKIACEAVDNFPNFNLCSHSY